MARSSDADRLDRVDVEHRNRASAAPGAAQPRAASIRPQRVGSLLRNMFSATVRSGTTLTSCGDQRPRPPPPPRRRPAARNGSPPIDDLAVDSCRPDERRRGSGSASTCPRRSGRAARRSRPARCRDRHRRPRARPGNAWSGRASRAASVTRASADRPAASMRGCIIAVGASCPGRSCRPRRAFSQYWCLQTKSAISSWLDEVDRRLRPTGLSPAPLSMVAVGRRSACMRHRDRRLGAGDRHLVGRRPEAAELPALDDRLRRRQLHVLAR